jgi:hypothetical protein
MTDKEFYQQVFLEMIRAGNHDLQADLVAMFAVDQSRDVNGERPMAYDHTTGEFSVHKESQ